MLAIELYSKVNLSKKKLYLLFCFKIDLSLVLANNIKIMHYIGCFSMEFKGLILLSLCVLAIGACDTNLPLETVNYVDVQKYTGTWYEIASFPTWFQKDCTGTTATYSLNKDGSIRIINKCFKKSLNGEEDIAEGVAYVDNTITNAKLKVSFFSPFKGDYWIIELADDYTYAVVGHPNRKYLWILSRTPEMSESTYQYILESIFRKGFDILKLTKTIQFSNPK